jgi:hypothetical protein
MTTARPLSTGSANTGAVAGAPVNRTGFIFDESDVRYLSLAELNTLSAQQLRIAGHEILARKGRFSKIPD